MPPSEPCRCLPLPGSAMGPHARRGRVAPARHPARRAQPQWGRTSPPVTSYFGCATSQRAQPQWGRTVGAEVERSHAAPLTGHSFNGAAPTVRNAACGAGRSTRRHAPAAAPRTDDLPWSPAPPGAVGRRHRRARRTSPCRPCLKVGHHRRAFLTPNNPCVSGKRYDCV